MQQAADSSYYQRSPFLATDRYDAVASNNAAGAAICVTLMQKMLDNDASECTLLHNYKQLNLDYALDTTITGYDNLLVNRNNKWLRHLQEAFAHNHCFVAVGFRHLYYRQGLITGLRKLGFTVEPVPLKIN